MAKVVGFNEKVYKRFTCYKCAAIVEYTPSEVIKLYGGNLSTPLTDEGVIIRGLNCPNCGEFHRTNH